MAAPFGAREVLDRFHVDYRAALNSGDYHPFVWPYRALGPYLLVFYLLLPPTQSRAVHLARYPIFALIVYLSVTAIRDCRSPAVTVGYGIGLLNAWTILWSATLLIFNDGRKDYQRIERQERPYVAQENDETLIQNTQGETTALDGSTMDGLKSLHPMAEIPQSIVASADDPETDYPEVWADQEPIPSDSPNQTYVWQPLPRSFPHRLDYILDLITNFRGLRWTHQAPHNTFPPPPHIRSSLPPPSPPPSLPPSHYPTRLTLFTKNLASFLLCSLTLDALKYLTSHDAYFLTAPRSSTPSPFPYPRTTRVIISLVFVYASLLNIFLLGPLLLSCALGPTILGPHASPWLYPPQFGPLSSIATNGLAGLWAGWWHQLFRHGFESAGEYTSTAILRLPRRRRKSTAGAAVRVAVAFACSGILHACASRTIPGAAHTRPWGRSFAFFAAQPVGIVAQRAGSAWLRRQGYREALPWWLRRAGNVAVVVAWCWLTGPWIADEFAAGGIWLYEPLPVSLIRGWRGEGWWRWGGKWVRWYSADRWWKSGLVFMGG